MTTKWLINVSPALDAAMRASGKPRAALVRELVAKWLKRPELAKLTAKIGRPKKGSTTSHSAVPK